MAFKNSTSDNKLDVGLQYSIDVDKNLWYMIFVLFISLLF